ncbi:hypothetical protein M5689_000963 [Euphorbia peplus]|nr:hypothetical protein M5689_000963 [Euphorbia peplus]
MCARHILANWAKKWRGVEARNAFCVVSKASFEAQLRDRLQEMNKLGTYICMDLTRYNKERWMRTYFPTTTKYDFVHNNIAETFNGWILDARHKMIITMLEEIRVKVVDMRRAMVEFAAKWITDISPMALSIFQGFSNRAMSCEIVWNGDDGFEVTECQYRYVVDLKLLTCSCRVWVLKGIPCAHAIATMHKVKMDPMQHVSHWYNKQTFLSCYSTCIQPVWNMHMWPESDHPAIQPPEVKALPGRPKKNRRKARDEVKKIGKLSRKGVQMSCSYCKAANHNKKGFPARKADLSQGFKRDRLPESEQQEPATKPVRKKRKQIETKQSFNTPANVSNQGQVDAQRTTTRKNAKNAQSGYGVFVCEKTGYSAYQTGKPGGIVISATPRHVKSSANVTGDIGFEPTKLKWKGKGSMLPDHLQDERAMRRAMHERRRMHHIQQSQASSAHPGPI